MDTKSNFTDVPNENKKDKTKTGNDYEDTEYGIHRASAFLRGFTYSYVRVEDRGSGTGCCKPTKQKCNTVKKGTKTTKTCLRSTSGLTVCGQKCTDLIESLEKLDKEEKKLQLANSVKGSGLEFAEDMSSEEMTSEEITSEEMSKEDSSEEESPQTKKKNRLVGKLSQDELQLLETASKMATQSKNPKCTKPKPKSLFR